MGLTCNIDARGKAARLRIGIGAFFIGLVLLLTWAIPAGTGLAWWITASLLFAAGFSIFEARAGWCALRAMGLRTPL